MSLQAYNNKSLFSNLYLTHLPSERAWWQTDVAESAWQALISIWEGFAPKPRDAVHIDAGWVQPVLRVLGHHPSQHRSEWLARDKRGQTYVLLAGDLQAPIAVVHVRAWGCRLDQPGPAGEDAPEPGHNFSPVFQVQTAMQAAGTPWGILTNGRLWRLYHRDTVHKLDVYYEVDLPTLIEPGSGGAQEQAHARGGTDEAEITQLEAFKYFYCFFCRNALAGESGWLNEMLAASHAFKREISRRLKDQAAQALQWLAQGFLEHPANAITLSPDVLQTVQDNSLILLQWLLFILHAEGHGHLPLNRNRTYTEHHSLHTLSRRIAESAQPFGPATSLTEETWRYLRRLWRLLNTGAPELDVPAHPGGLFDLEQHPFLRQHRIPDACLQPAIDLLTRTEDPLTGQTTFIDYRDLEIRDLGSIYESLLGYHLEISHHESPQPPTSNLQSPISLVIDEGKRKSTGSYYTPGHIVRWLVEQTLRPVLDDIRRRHIIQQPPDGVCRIITSPSSLTKDMLSVKVLDPAMGSGHFLVEATDFIARYLVSLGLGPMPDLGDESELTYWRRRVVQSCIYGVDANPLAVELTRLSLWSTTAVHGKPLSFLDHHLRCGDTLVGVRMSDLHLATPGSSQRKGQTSGQLSMLDNAAFVRSMQTAADLAEQIQALGSAGPGDVRQAGHLYHHRLRQTTQRYHILADLWTARHFGLQIGSALWSRLIPHVLQDDLASSPYADLIQQAREIARDRRFFHWELEFPDIFFPPSSPSQVGEKGEGAGGRGERAPGFDAIIGNPPYLFGENIPSHLKPFLRRHYDLAVGQYDAYWLFYERSFWLLKPGGRHGFIVPDAILARDEAEVLRTRLLEDYRVTAIARVGHAFDHLGVGAVLLVWEKSPPRDHLLEVWQYHDSAWHQVRSLPLRELARSPRHRLLVELDPVSLTRVTHLQMAGRPLRLFLAVSRGEEAGRRHLRPIERQRAGDVPILIGRDISPLGPPTPSHCIPESRAAKPRSIYRPGKIVMVKTGRDLVCTIDNTGYVTLQSVYNLRPHPTCRLRLEYLAALLSSSLLSWYLRATVTGYKQLFPQLNQSNVEELPIRPIRFTTPADARAALVEEGKHLYESCTAQRDWASLLEFVERQLNRQPEQADVIHDLLVWLVEQVMGLNRRRQDLRPMLDPFRYLDREIPFVECSTVFGQAVAQTAEVHALDNVYHDIAGLRLEPAGDAWELQVQLKKRDPHNRRAWQREPETRRIAREWVPAGRLALADAKARYYQVAFEVLERFHHVRSFPGGHTRTTWQKLQATRVPAFDPHTDLSPLLDARRELVNIETRLIDTFELIDQIVCRLYGLTNVNGATYPK